MILVTVGSTGFKFDRLFRILDELCDEGVLTGDKLVVQTGKTDYEPRNFKSFEFIEYEKMEELVSSSEYIICHSGTGTVVGALKKGKKIIVFPRLKVFNEHESNHQLDLAETFCQEGYVLAAKDKSELKNAIAKVKDFAPKKFVSNTQNFLKLLKSLL